MQTYFDIQGISFRTSKNSITGTIPADSTWIGRNYFFMVESLTFDEKMIITGVRPKDEQASRGALTPVIHLIFAR